MIVDGKHVLLKKMWLAFMKDKFLELQVNMPSMALELDYKDKTMIRLLSF